MVEKHRSRLRPDTPDPEDRVVARNRRNVEKKILPPDAKDEQKPGPCLGPDCDKQIMRTKRIWLCDYCRKKISEIEGEAGVFIAPASTSEE